MPPVR